MLSNMPVQTRCAAERDASRDLFGEMTNTDVYVKTRQKEFNYPQGASNSLTSYEGSGGIVLRLSAPHHDRARPRRPGEAAFSDDVTPESRLLMRRNLKDRVSALAPFLTTSPIRISCLRRWPSVLDHGRVHIFRQLSYSTITGSATID